MVVRAVATYLANPIDDNAWLDHELEQGVGALPLLLSDDDVGNEVGLFLVLLCVAHAAGISFHLLAMMLRG